MNETKFWSLIAFRNRFIDEMSDHIEQVEEIYSSRVRNIIDSHPSIFGAPSETELDQRDLEVSEIKIDQTIEIGGYKDFIKESTAVSMSK